MASKVVDEILKDYGPASKLGKRSSKDELELPNEILIDDVQSSSAFHTAKSNTNNVNPSKVQFDTNAKPEAVEKSAVEKLQAQLEKARSDLDKEKSNRKRKEKSMIKLAKELNNRSTDMDSKDKKIEELEETIADLTDRLRLRSKESSEVVELSQKNRLMEKKLQLYEEKLAYQKTLLRESKRQDPSPKSVEPEEIAVHKITKRGYEGLTPVSSSSSHHGRVWIVMAMVALLSYVALVLLGGWDGVCAPVRPGSVLDANHSKILYSAPWWVPDAYQESAIVNTLCYHYPKTQLKLAKGRLEVVKDKKTIWKGRAAGVQVGWTALRVIDRKGGVSDEIPAPWISSS